MAEESTLSPEYDRLIRPTDSPFKIGDFALLYRASHVLEDLGWVELVLGSSPGWWAATVATYCLSRMVEHPKSKSTNPSPRGHGTLCIEILPSTVRITQPSNRVAPLSLSEEKQQPLATALGEWVHFCQWISLTQLFIHRSLLLEGQHIYIYVVGGKEQKRGGKKGADEAMRNKCWLRLQSFPVYPTLCSKRDAIGQSVNRLAGDHLSALFTVVLFCHPLISK